MDSSIYEHIFRMIMTIICYSSEQKQKQQQTTRFDSYRKCWELMVIDSKCFRLDVHDVHDVWVYGMHENINHKLLTFCQC